MTAQSPQSPITAAHSPSRAREHTTYRTLEEFHYSCDRRHGTLDAHSPHSPGVHARARHLDGER